MTPAFTMLGRTLACCMFLTAGAEALPQSFALDMGSIDGAVLDSSRPAPLFNTTNRALSSTTTFQTTLLTPPTSTPKLTAASNSTIPTPNRAIHTTCLPTTTIVITLPNPTPRPTTTSERSDEEEILTDDEQHVAATPFDTATPEPLSKWPYWFTAATFTLVFYDILTMGIFLWLWVLGYLWWFRRGSGTQGSERRWGRGAVLQRRVDMARVDRFGRDGFGRYERTSEWVGTGRGYGRVRSESWERARSAREAELEGEMRRLGMI